MDNPTEKISLPLQDKTPNNKSKIFNLKFALIISIPTLILVMVFILDYFNILTLNKLFSFVKIPASKNVSVPQTVQKDIKAFIKDSFIPTFAASSLEVQRTTPKTKAMNQSVNQFYASWNLPDGQTGNISVVYDKQLSLENKYTGIMLPNLSVLTASSAAALTEQYFTIKPEGTWKCNQINLSDKESIKANICENFWVDSQQIKHGVGVITPPSISSQTTSIFNCEIYPQSPLYSWKSCSIYTH